MKVNKKKQPRPPRLSEHRLAMAGRPEPLNLEPLNPQPLNLEPLNLEPPTWSDILSVWHPGVNMLTRWRTLSKTPP